MARRVAAAVLWTMLVGLPRQVAAHPMIVELEPDEERCFFAELDAQESVMEVFVERGGKLNIWVTLTGPYDIGDAGLPSETDATQKLFEENVQPTATNEDLSDNFRSLCRWRAPVQHAARASHDAAISRATPTVGRAELARTSARLTTHRRRRPRRQRRRPRFFHRRSNRRPRHPSSPALTAGSRSRRRARRSSGRA